ncbi:hypothetical protein D3C71_1834430 [compost metagenome]
MRRPIRDSPRTAVYQQVIFNLRIEGQGAVQRHIDQMNKGMGAYWDDRALPAVQGNVADTLQAQGQRQRPGPDQPKYQARRLKTPQQRADEDGRQCGLRGRR